MSVCCWNFLEEYKTDVHSRCVIHSGYTHINIHVSVLEREASLFSPESNASEMYVWYFSVEVSVSQM